MKGIQKYRLGVQILCFILTLVGFFTHFEITMLVILGLTLLSGAFYCGWICPYGFMQDLGAKLGRLLGIKKVKMPKALQKILVFTRYIILGLVLFIASDVIFGIMSFDPRANFGSLLLRNIPSIGALAVIIFFVFVSMFFERPFCNYFCFEGAKYGLFSSLRPFTIKRESPKCVNCKKCDKVCPMNIQVSKCTQLRSPQCINCFECVSNCPVKDTLSYGKVNFTNYEIKRYVALIFILFIGVLGFIGYNTIYNVSHTADANVSSQKLDETTEEVPEAESDEVPEVSSAPSDNVLAASDKTSHPSNDSSQVAAASQGETSAGNNVITSTNESAKASNTESQKASPKTFNNTSAPASTETSNAAKALPKVEVLPSQDATSTANDTITITDESAKVLGDAAGIADGVYTGSGEGFKGTTTVEVTVSKEQITKIEVIETRDDRKWFQRAYASIPDAIVSSQSTDVDTVGGATFSSVGIISAVKDALANAK